MPPRTAEAQLRQQQPFRRLSRRCDRPSVLRSDLTTSNAAMTARSTIISRKSAPISSGLLSHEGFSGSSSSYRPSSMPDISMAYDRDEAKSRKTLAMPMESVQP